MTTREWLLLRFLIGIPIALITLLVRGNLPAMGAVAAVSVPISLMFVRQRTSVEWDAERKALKQRQAEHLGYSQWQEDKGG